MKKIKYIGLTFSILLLLGGCEQEVLELRDKCEVDPSSCEEQTCPEGASPGSANFTKFVAIGNSLTAGLQGAALYSEGQENSLANILATQFECVGGGEFNQPDINSVNGYNTIFSDPANGVILGRLVLFDPDGAAGPAGPGPAPAGAPGVPAPYNTADLPAAYAGDKTKLNNFGVPGILLGQVLTPFTGGPSTGNPAYNPLYARFASNPGTSTILGDATTALASGGTFFMFYLGSNDVLGYALSGASNEDIFTSTDDFTTYYNGAIATLLSVPNVKGVVGNIPYVTYLPFFRAVPYNPVPMTSQAVVDQLNGASGYGSYNGGLDMMFGAGLLTAEERDKRKVQFALGANPVVIVDEYLTDLSAYGIPSYREAGPTDLVLLTASTFIGTTIGGDPTKVNGVSVPLADKWILVPEEQQAILTRTAQFNGIIAATVANSDDRIALADVNAAHTALLTQGQAVVDGIVIKPTFAPPYSILSPDGVHPNNRGYAFTANIFIDAINAKFGASVPKADISKYSTNILPLSP
jgi:hypothetical protein